MSYEIGCDIVSCLLSHKCSAETHELGKRMQNVLSKCKVELLVDSFPQGVDINAGIDSFEIDALLFLFSPKSFKSEYCRRELAIARSRGIPVFTIRLAGDVPKTLMRRVYINLPVLDDAALKQQLDELGESIYVRGNLYRTIAMLPEQPPEISYKDAQKIHDLTERTVLAEFVRQLGAQYRRVSDPNTRFWIATALGKAGTRMAGKILQGLLKEDDHPLAQHGVLQAIETIDGQ